MDSAIPHNSPVLRVLLMIATFFGLASLQEVHTVLAVILQIVSIISFVIAGSYTVWKWRVRHKEYKKKNG